MMRGVMRVLVGSVSALLMSAAQADASDWVLVGTNNVDDVLEINAATLKVDDQVVTFWVKTKLNKPKEVIIGGVSKKSTMTLSKVQIACDNQTIATLAWASYDASGSMLNSAHNDDFKPTAIFPDSVGDTFSRIVCARVKAKRP